MIAQKLAPTAVGLAGAGLALASIVRFANLEWEAYVTVRDVGLWLGGIGLAVALFAMAARFGAGGWGAALCTAALGIAVVDAFGNVSPIWSLVVLSLLSVGTPMLAHTIARRTRLLSPAGVFATASLGALGVALTADVAGEPIGDTLQLDQQTLGGLNNALNIAAVLGLLVAALAAGIAVASAMSGTPAPPVARDASRSAPPPTADGGDDEDADMPAAAGAAADADQPLNRYQRLTLMLALLGTIASALISVLGAIIAAMISTPSS